MGRRQSEIIYRPTPVAVVIVASQGDHYPPYHATGVLTLKIGVIEKRHDWRARTGRRADETRPPLSRRAFCGTDAMGQVPNSS